MPLIVASARKLKRVLADEQNEVLDALRSKEPVADLDRLVPAPPEQADRYVEAITAELIAAAEAGAAAVTGERGHRPRPGRTAGAGARPARRRARRPAARAPRAQRRRR